MTATATAAVENKQVITGRVFYQAEYGGGEWEDSWSRHSGLYSSKEYALEYLAAMGFDVTKHKYGVRYGLKPEAEAEAYMDNYAPHWSIVKEVVVIK